MQRYWSMLQGLLTGYCLLFTVMEAFRRRHSVATYLGCPVWTHKGWLGTLFPKGTKQSDYLKVYSQTFNTVEGNTTFYAVPSEETVARWAAVTPATFRFCPKLPRDISHARSLAEGTEAAQAFIERMGGLGERLGPIFAQLPPTYGLDRIDDLQAFLDAWPRDTRLGVEVRHPDFFMPEGNTTLNWLLADYDVARVMMDVRPIRHHAEAGDDQEALDVARDRKPDVPLLPDVTAPFTLVRYIGHPQRPLNAPFFDEWAARLDEWAAKGTELFFVCHCPDDTYAPALCADLRDRLAARGLMEPPGEQLEQETLF